VCNVASSSRNRSTASCSGRNLAEPPHVAVHHTAHVWRHREVDLLRMRDRIVAAKLPAHCERQELSRFLPWLFPLTKEATMSGASDDLGEAATLPDEAKPGHTNGPTRPTATHELEPARVQIQR
jgi:hypothetical protein